MKFSRLRRRLAQTTSEYMIVLSVAAAGTMAVMYWFGRPENPVQQGAKGLADDMTNSLSNDAGGNSMRVR